ncbi:YbhB/YbcL family Raf kinase inhibitor-like protein [Povalibacter sp.]|uniref:YbhB/YbcL family Raf kinase inhibitor-like protein n=1 Tax=Povalibacter sp. TaxID=1962978 RepID=UPI002F42494F
MRTNTSRYRPILSGLLALAIPIAEAQQGQLTDVEITAHIYEPQRLAATDARLATLELPSGFHLQRFAEGLDNPRIVAVAPDGAVYVTQRTPGNVVMLRDLDGDGIADTQRIVVRLKQAHGLAIRQNEIYLTDIKRVYVATIFRDGSVGPLRTVVRNLPDGGQHPNRTIGFGPEGDLFISVGSLCNECRDPNPEVATLLRVPALERRRARADRWGREIFASGLRNTIGFDWQPGSGRLFGLDHGIDMLGDNEQSEELNLLVAGKRYGWPYVYDEDQINPHTEPLFLTSQQWAERSEEPVGLYTPHAAPMQMRFYAGSQLPADYRDDAYATFRGSWNRKPPSGYEVVRLRFAGGEFEGFEPLVSGFLQQQSDGSFGFFARPVGLAETPDGALIVGDDTNNTLYRVSYGAPSVEQTSSQSLAIDILEAPRTLSVRSPAIAAGGIIPRKYSDYGKGISPPLSWSDVPASTRSIVVLMEDPDAIAPLPFVHWTLINASPSLRGLPEAIDERYQPRRVQALQGSNSKTEQGYFGPRPPFGDPPHRYHFQVFALDTRLDLPEGFNRQALLKALRGHVLASGELVGSFQAPQ